MTDKINQENKNIWNANANYWDNTMGDLGNRFHQELVAPATVQLLNLKAQDTLLDIGCGNGVFARRMAQQGIQVTAFDFSENNINNAKKYDTHNIHYQVLDATSYEGLLALGKHQFTAAVANMMLMDLANIDPLFRALPHLLQKDGVFVFSVCHPCFNSCNVVIQENTIEVNNYQSLHTTKGEAIANQPQLQYYFDRSISNLLQTGFKHGFVVDGMEEPVFKQYKKAIFTKVPMVLVVRMRRNNTSFTTD